MKPLSKIFLLLTLVVVAGLLPCADVWAQATPKTAQEQMVRLAGQSASIPQLIAVICYAIGVFYTARALLALKNYISNSDENPINPFISFGAIGSLLIMLPYAIIVMADTLGARVPTVESSAKTMEKETDYGLVGSDTDYMGDVFTNLSGEFIPMAKVMAIFAYAWAGIITLVGLISLKNYGDDPSQTPVRSILMKFVLASLLISLPFAMQIFITSVTGRSGIEDQTNVSCRTMISSPNMMNLRNKSKIGHKAGVGCH